MPRDRVDVHNVDTGNVQVLTFTQAKALLSSLKPQQGVARCMREIRDELTVEVGSYRFELHPHYLD